MVVFHVCENSVSDEIRDRPPFLGCVVLDKLFDLFINPDVDQKFHYVFLAFSKISRKKILDFL